MPHKKNSNSKQIKVDDMGDMPNMPTSVKIGLSTTGIFAATGLFIVPTLLDNGCGPRSGCDLASALAPTAAGAITALTGLGMGVLSTVVTEITLLNKKEIIEKYEEFKKLPVAQQIVLGIAAYNILVGAGVGGSYFAIANAATSEYLFDAALHFLNAYALNSDNILINAIAFTGNIARLSQINSVLSTGTSTIPNALNNIDKYLNHPSTMLLGFGTKLWSKLAPLVQAAVTNEQNEPARRNIR